LKGEINREETVSGREFRLEVEDDSRADEGVPPVSRGERGRGTGSGFLVSRPWAVSGTGPIWFPLAFFYFFVLFLFLFSVFYFFITFAFVIQKASNQFVNFSKIPSNSPEL
jgi:hypothetical protein